MASSTEWFIAMKNGSVLGPLSEAELRADLANGKIPLDASIRQGTSRWHSMLEIKRVFRSLEKNGWYVKRLSGSIHGPFTKDRFKQLIRADELTSNTLVRLGSRGNWLPLGLLEVQTNRRW